LADRGNLRLRQLLFSNEPRAQLPRASVPSVRDFRTKGDTPYYNYFAAENPQINGDIYASQDAGCAATSNVNVNLVSQTGSEAIEEFPCFEHPTLTDLIESAQTGIGWLYYGDQANSIWTAPNAIRHICGASGGSCQGPDFTKHVFTEQTGNLAPFMKALQNCTFAYGDQSAWKGGVMWVIPDGRWSDHAGQNNPTANIGLGPDFVANIVNLLGRTSSQGACTGYMPNWSNTVILVVWDDWGGWYDHVKPFSTTGYVGGNGNGKQYVYGFRVPLLVVSTYAQQAYISNTNHDFGSILQFIENVFTPSKVGQIYPTYPFADAFAGGTGTDNLADFFQANTLQFKPINLYNNHNLCNASTCPSSECYVGGPPCNCDATCLINYNDGSGPQDPDDD
jgi:hypothetical protein